MIIGTPHYMAPEQAKGQAVDGRADEYSLGVVGYRMITGELPFAGDSVHTILYKHIFEEAPRAASRRADVPEFLSATISRAMSKEPDHRYATMEEFASAVWPEQPVAPPHEGRPVVRQRHRVMADARTEITTELLSEAGFVVSFTDDAGADQQEAFKQREFEKRFVVQHVVDDTVMTDDWNEVLQIIERAEDDLCSWNAEKHLWEKP